MNKQVTVVVVILLLAAGTVGFLKFTSGKKADPSDLPSPTPAAVKQLAQDKYPQVSLTFTSDGHYVTVEISNIHAASLEYNLIYDATVKGSPVNTGVTGSAKVADGDTYTYKQLLGSESSGKFTYHEDIHNAVMELTLRDENRYSIFNSTYPFEVAPGKTIELTLSSGN